jgi:Tol biopolymer transport system component
MIRSISTCIFAIGLAGCAVTLFGYQDKTEFHSRIAFIQPTPGGSGHDIYTMNPDGSDVRQVTNLGPNDSANYENWSPDGRQLVFNDTPAAGPPRLWVINADGSNLHLLLNDGAAYQNWSPSFSPSGAEVVFTRCNTDFQCAIYRVGTDGSGLTPITEFLPGENDWEPVYSRDGSTIAFDSFDRDGLLSAIWLMNADGSDIRSITPSDICAVNPHWSSDGEELVFRSHFCNPQNNDVWVIHRDGRDLRRLTGDASSDLDIPVAYYVEGPSWSPDGSAVVFFQYMVSTSTQGIYIVNSDGSGRTQLMARSVAARTAGHASQNKRHHGPRQIEQNGFWPRWSPYLP